MERKSSLLLGVAWRVAVMLVLFNPVLSLSHWLLVSWKDSPGLVLIVLAVVALVLLYMLSLAREFPGVTVTTAIGLAVILAGAALQGWVDLADLRFWQWAAPVLAGILFAAGPAFAIIRRREAGISAADETPG